MTPEEKAREYAQKRVPHNWSMEVWDSSPLWRVTFENYESHRLAYLAGYQDALKAAAEEAKNYKFELHGERWPVGEHISEAITSLGEGGGR